MRIKTPKTQKLFKRETCGEINVFFVVFISLFQPVPAQWFHVVTVAQTLCLSPPKTKNKAKMQEKQIKKWYLFLSPFTQILNMKNIPKKN